jgi:hypothetical protein
VHNLAAREAPVQSCWAGGELVDLFEGEQYPLEGGRGRGRAGPLREAVVSLAPARIAGYAVASGQRSSASWNV